MLGRVRRSTISSLEQLESERPSSKLMKADSLSIYETTLMKLREGSRRDTSFPAESSVDGNIHCLTSGGSPREEASITDANSSSENLEDTSGCQPTGSLRETKKSNVSLAYMFSMYRSSQRARGTTDEDAMVIEDEDGICSANSSLSPNNSQLMSSSVQTQSAVQEHIFPPMI
ncbi:uncharacterized protein LOC107787154 [Nicotiana tabacum]|uniref:Uncharacterized protein LOC107787154 n=2 Tax=Nicotiana TaxID=4085 RepID=A0A1S3ZIF6_TOBAC|nr:PREDICTED: uncharacterized protein LOC104235488 [Nicotiana sylvestris]XP_016464164.1 PREDICTED: uncharacterized protein LOC107787154 [Nicotiana tabacum]